MSETVKIIQYTLKGKEIRIFNSIAEAAKELKMVRTGISFCCTNDRFSAGEYRFSYYGKDLVIPQGPEQCLLCETGWATPHILSKHISQVHKITTEKYTIEQLFQNNRPFCCAENCNKITRYHDFGFQEYCKEHAYLGWSKGGKNSIQKLGPPKYKGLTKATSPQLAQQAANMTGPANHFYNKNHSTKTINLLKETGRISKEEYYNRLKTYTKYFFVITPYEEYTRRNDSSLKAFCLENEHKQEISLCYLEEEKPCRICFPIAEFTKPEIDLREYVESLGFVVSMHDREQIKPKEIDLFIPEKNIGIEYHGLWWHSERTDNFDTKSHAKKYNLCKEKGIRLLQFFGDEWKQKQEIVKSMIKSRLHLSDVKIDARKCSVKTITEEESKLFFDETHIAGYVRSKISFGLFDKEDVLISVLSLRKSWKKEEGQELVEIARFSSKLFYNVRGGFSKLLKRAEVYAKENNYTKIISYCDLRHGTGKVYEESGFTFVKEGENYWYTDGVNRFGRFKYRATEEKTEKEVAEEAGVYKISGCGNSLYEKVMK